MQCGTDQRVRQLHNGIPALTKTSVIRAWATTRSAGSGPSSRPMETSIRGAPACAGAHHAPRDAQVLHARTNQTRSNRGHGMCVARTSDATLQARQRHTRVPSERSGAAALARRYREQCGSRLSLGFCTVSIIIKYWCCTALEKGVFSHTGIKLAASLGGNVVMRSAWAYRAKAASSCVVGSWGGVL